MMIAGIDLVHEGAMMTACPHKRELSCEGIASIVVIGVMRILQTNADWAPYTVCRTRAAMWSATISASRPAPPTSDEAPVRWNFSPTK